MRRMYSKPQLLEAVESESKLNGIKVFEDIKDKDGHPRFIEGDITLETISGLTQTYGKWSLSGSHLLIVLAYTIANGTTTGYLSTLFNVNFPKWIADKINPVGNTYIEGKTFQAYDSTDNTQNVQAQLRKSSQGNIFVSQSSVTATADRTVRIAFDLLIDNE